MITDEDRSAPGIDMHCVSDKVDELVDGQRRLTVVLQGEYSDEAVKDGVLAQLQQDIRMYAGEFSSTVITAMKTANDRMKQELEVTQRELRQERDRREQLEAELEGHASLLSSFGQSLKTPATTT